MDDLREYKRLRAKVEKEYQDKLRALGKLFGVSTVAAANNGRRDVVKLRRGELTQSVMAAASKLSGDFTVADVEAAILKEAPTFDKSRAAISTVLKRLQGKHVLTLVEEGSGQQPARYKKKA